MANTNANANIQEIRHTYNTRSSKQTQVVKPVVKPINKRKYKQAESSSSEDDDDGDDVLDIDDDMSEDEDDILSEDEDDFIVKDNKTLDKREFQGLLAELFPSKYINNKLENLKPATNKPRRKYSRYEREAALSPPDEPLACSTPVEPLTPIPPFPSRKKFDKYKVEEEETVHSPNKANGMSNFNIIFTIKPAHMGKDKKIEDYEEYHSEDDNSEDDNSEDDPDYDPENDKDADEDDYDEYEDEEEAGSDEAGSSEAGSSEAGSEEEEEEDIDMDIDIDTNKPGKKKKSRAFKKQSKLCKKRKFKNTLKFRTLLQQKNVMNDLNYFQEKMSLEEQETVLKQMAEIKSIIDIEKPYRLALLEAAIPARFKACAYTKLSALKNMEPGCSEYNKVKHWVDDFMRIPFNKINHLPVTIEDGVDKCHDFMENAKNILDKAVYGLNDVKLQVMQMVGQWITNPDAIGNSVAIEGPPGTGKTTLVKEGISKILNREFVFIPLGGATDSSCLEGHSYTYEGSNCGLIVKQLIQCQSMNPIIYFDELDKISDTPKGEEIVGILTHLTDTSQNSKFHDKYFAEFDFDLSRCVFFFSYNDRSKVNRILLDRMHCIMTRGYELPQKTIISQDYLLPVIREQVRFKMGDIILPEETIHHIVNTHTHKEDGVRNLKRCLEIIHTKLNLYRLMRPDTNLFEKDMDIKVEFPITITPTLVDKLIKTQSEKGAWQSMYM